MKTILVATDFSERSDRALRRATLLARQSGAGLSLVHVVDDDRPRRIVESERDTATQLLGEQAATIRDVDGIACETRIILADPFAGIVQAADEGAPDLLIIGPHRRQALRDVFVGTTAERTIRAVSCPVLMTNAPPAKAYHSAVFATDLSLDSRSAADVFMALGVASHATLTILYVYDAPEIRIVMSHTLREEDKLSILARTKREAEGALTEFTRAFGARWSRHIVRDEKASTPQEILAAAKELSADLIVVGTRRTGFERLILGSVAEDVLRSADRDVLAIPPHRRC